MTTASKTTSQARIISIGGGKGGVGKSVVAANVAVAMAEKGVRVVLADLDLGAANQHLLLGVDRPRPGISALLSNEITDISEALSATPVANLFLLSGTGASVGAANITYAEKLRILRKLRTLPADVVIVDVGAGVGYNALDFFELGTQRIVVVTPQVTSIHDAYAFLKGAVLRTLRHQADKTAQVDLLKAAEATTEGDKVTDLLARIRTRDRAFGDKVMETLRRFPAYLVGNQVSDPAQAGVFASVSKMMQDYLGITVPILGWLRASTKISDSINKRQPLTLGGSGEDARTLRGIAEALLVEEVDIEDDLFMDGDEDGAPAVATMRPELPLPAAAASAEVPARLTPPPMPAAEAAPAARAPAKIVPRIYVAPPRARHDREEAKRAVEPRKRRFSLPGMTPRARGT